MTNAETLVAAIDRLEELRDECGNHEYWEAMVSGSTLWRRWAIYGFELNWYYPETHDMAPTKHIAEVGDGKVSELLITLYRTIDAQLTILQSALGDSEGSHDEPAGFALALELARAILGVTEPAEPLGVSS